MDKKYKHIKLPTALQGTAVDYAPHKQGRPEELPGFEDKSEHKQHLAQSANELRGFAKKIRSERRIDREKELVDIKLKVQGQLNPGFFTKYNLKVGARFDDRATGQDYTNDTVIARVSNKKLPRQEKSDFEKLEADITLFVNSNKDKLKTYFSLVEEYSPVTSDVIVDKAILDQFGKDRSSKILLDIVFSDDQASMTEKLNDLKEFLGSNYISSVNTELVHVCQAQLTKSKLDEVFYSYGGIVSVEESMKIVFSSSTSTPLGDVEIEVTANNNLPVLIADYPVNYKLPLLEPVFMDQVGDEFKTGGDQHGTNVASLVVYGPHLNSAGNLKLENTIASVNIVTPVPGSDQFSFNTDKLTEALEKYSDPNNTLVVNLSINSEELIYLRKTPHWFSVLIDEYSVKYNCLFVISAGNLGNGWEQDVVDKVMELGYPEHFTSEYSMIHPPADSMNSLSVGSVAYAATPQSVSRQLEPTLITRRGLLDVKTFNLIKPDLVHYDSNFNEQFVSEDNGPYMATTDGGITRSAGTSFAAPLVAHHAGIIVQAYPEYTVNTVKALLIHFAKEVKPQFSIDAAVTSSLVGHGIPDLERTLYSLANSSTLIIEDNIKVGTSKVIRVPVPPSIAGTNAKRFKISKTLVYNPRINNKDVSTYSPVHLTARIKKPDGTAVDSSFTQNYLNGAHKTSNVKSYKAITMSTKRYTGGFWEIEVMSEPCSPQTDVNYVQEYSIVVSMDDLRPAEGGNIHEEIQQMIEVEVGVEVGIDVE